MRVPQEGGTSLPHLLTKAGLLQPYVPLPSRVARSYKRYNFLKLPSRVALYTFSQITLSVM